MRLPAPDSDLRVSVVIPAKNEEERLGACLAALAGQVGVKTSEFEVLLVLDGCVDSSREVAMECLERHESLRLRLLEGPDRGVGSARKLGMDAACERLAAVEGPDGLIASTDADSVVAPDWVSAQLSLVGDGAEAIGGKICLVDGGENLRADVIEWYEEQGRERYAKVLARQGEDSFTQDHWQFSGASMSLTVEAYRRIGGLESVRYLEDERLERQLENSGVRVVRSAAVRVTTSDRTRGRAERGLAFDLARASRTLGP